MTDKSFNTLFRRLMSVRLAKFTNSQREVLNLINTVNDAMPLDWDFQVIIQAITSLMKTRGLDLRIVRLLSELYFVVALTQKRAHAELEMNDAKDRS